MAHKKTMKGVLVIVAVLVGAYLLFKNLFAKPAVAVGPVSSPVTTSTNAAAAGILGFGAAIANLINGQGSSSSSLSSAQSSLSSIFGNSGSINDYYAGDGISGSIDPTSTDSLSTEFDTLA